MSVLTLSFICFLLTVLVLYYVVPKKTQWIVLLAASCVFYLSFGAKYILYILTDSLLIYVSARQMNKIDEKQRQAVRAVEDRASKKAVKAQFQSKKKRLLICTLIAVFGILVAVKYSVFLYRQICSLGSLLLLPPGFFPEYRGLVAPIGFSFYTFQSTGYLLDVYWKKYESEKNYARFLLFVSFFPQIIQGPINRFDHLSDQLFAQHAFDYHRFSYGCQRMVWGFLKKTVVADRISPYLSDIFANYTNSSGLNLLCAAFMYSVQIYADFSGYMDIFCGFCEILGIDMAENFERPYFSKSVAEYWRRWHITLGAWFKDYLYYPIALSRFAQNSSKRAKKRFGQHIGKNTPAIIALVLVWFLTGLWHGASWAYIAWGGLNGFFIIFSMLFEPLYDKAKSALHIRESSRMWHAFQVLRTFCLVTMIKVFPEVGTFSDGVGFFGSMIRNMRIPTGVWDILPAPKGSLDYPCLALMVALMFTVSVIQRKRSVRDYLHEKPVVLRWGVYLCAVLILLLLGGSVEGTGGGFMYAQF